jgi:hypothetical protein
MTCADLASITPSNSLSFHLALDFHCLIDHYFSLCPTEPSAGSLGLMLLLPSPQPLSYASQSAGLILFTPCSQPPGHPRPSAELLLYFCVSMMLRAMGSAVPGV